MVKKLQSYYFVDKDTSPLELPLNILLHSYKRGETCFHFHNHSPLEIIAVLEGELAVMVDKKNYLLKTGDVCLFNPYESHSGVVAYNTDTVKFLGFTVALEQCLSFSKSALSQNIKQLLNGEAYFENYYSAESPSASELCFELIALNDMMSFGNRIDYSCKKLASCFKILGLLFEKHYKERKEKSAAFKRNNDFMSKITEFIENNYNKDDISSACLAKELYISVDHFCHLFRRHYGTSFLAYLCQYRINKSITLYKGSNIPISDIARAVGFSDYSYFSRAFKKQVGISPARYFGKWKN